MTKVAIVGEVAQEFELPGDSVGRREFGCGLGGRTRGIYNTRRHCLTRPSS